MKQILNDMINESVLNEMQCTENTAFTGEQIADMLGMGDKYRTGKAQIAQDEAMMESVKGKFTTLMERFNKVDEKNKKDIID